MNCVFICVFNNIHYINMLFLLLDSIYNYGLLNSSFTEILIYCSTKFMRIIKQSPFYKNLIQLIHFETNDTCGSIEKACWSRLDLFDLSIQKYSKILYLDTDIIIKGDLNLVFDLCQKDKLYALEEGSINCDTDFWGKTLFLNAGDLDIYTNNAFSSAFSSGVLLFNNCQVLRELFLNIRNDFLKRPFKFYCHDQPYIVYNAFKYDLYDNQVLKEFVVNNDHNIKSNKIIHHFPGDPGMHQHKLTHMFAFLSGLKECDT